MCNNMLPAVRMLALSEVKITAALMLPLSKIKFTECVSIFFSASAKGCKNHNSKRERPIFTWSEPSVLAHELNNTLKRL